MPYGLDGGQKDRQEDCQEDCEVEVCVQEGTACHGDKSVPTGCIAVGKSCIAVEKSCATADEKDNVRQLRKQQYAEMLRQIAEEQTPSVFLKKSAPPAEKSKEAKEAKEAQEAPKTPKVNESPMLELLPSSMPATVSEETFENINEQLDLLDDLDSSCADAEEDAPSPTDIQIEKEASAAAQKSKIKSSQHSTPKPITADPEEYPGLTDIIADWHLPKIQAELFRQLRCGELRVEYDGYKYEALPWGDISDSNVYGSEYESGANSAGYSPDPDEEPENWEDPRFPKGTLRVADEINPKDTIIAWAYYQRVSFWNLLARLTLDTTVQIKWFHLTMEVHVRYDVDIMFDMEHEMECQYSNYCIHRPPKAAGNVKEKFSGPRMDEYGVPRYSIDDIEKAAERILDKIYPEGLKDPRQISVQNFLDRLGLKVVYIPLYNHDNTNSILFFEAGKVQACIKIDDKREKRYWVHVDANTIVINTNKPLNARTAIFHECFHYMEHIFFYKIQKLQHNDMVENAKTRLHNGRTKNPKIQIKSKQSSSDNGHERTPVEWMEWQARYGAQCLQMPRTLTSERIVDELCKLSGSGLHIGEQLEVVGLKLTEEFHVRPYQVHNRMIWLEWPEARGCLNYVDGRFIHPFAFDTDTCKGSQTFVISPAEAMKEYAHNKKFRELIKTGKYAYADGHICINHPDVLSSGRQRLTFWANRHVDQCCLRFYKSYYKTFATGYVFGRLNSDEEYNVKKLSLAAARLQPISLADVSEVTRLLNDLKPSFHEAFKQIREAYGVTIDELAEETQIAPRTLYKYEEEELKRYSADIVVVLGIGMRLDPPLTRALLQRARILLGNSEADMMLDFAIQIGHTHPVMEVRNWLEASKYPRIKSWPEDKDGKVAERSRKCV